MNDYHSPRKRGAQAMALRQQVAEIDDNYFNPMLKYDYSDTLLAKKLWLEHVKLLKLVYPKPDPRDHIKVTLRDIYRDNAVVLTTSFANMCEYSCAYDQLGWDYELVSLNIGIQPSA